MQVQVLVVPLMRTPFDKVPTATSSADARATCPGRRETFHVPRPQVQ